MRARLIALTALGLCCALGLLWILGLPERGLGQGCSNWMTPAYSAYASSSSDGTYVYTSVTLNGTTHGTCPFGCNINCSGVQHTPRAYNVTGGVGGWGSGSSALWSESLTYTNNQQVAAAPGTLVNWSSQEEVICSLVGTFWLTNVVQTQAASYTKVQHNYPRNPLPQPCWISSFFDAVRNSHAHRAEDVTYDNGQGTGGVTPPYGAPVYAMEAGTVIAEVSTAGPASGGYPACVETGAAGNYVKIQTSDGYSTIYFHVKPIVSVTQNVNAGQEIGTLDNSGCQSGAHVHVARKDPFNIPVNFTLPCTNPTPTNKFYDGLVDDSVPDNL